MLLVSLAVISGVAFAMYGAHTLFAEQPKAEFERYGLPGARVAVGVAQSLGALGVLLGLAVSQIGAAAAFGLALMMVFAVLTRWKIGDAPSLMVPAATLAALHVALIVLFLQQ